MKILLMKLRYLIPSLFLTYTASAQLTVTPGAEFFINGDIPLTLKNIDLVNNGILAGGVNTTSFTGDASSSISGSGTLRFFQLKVDKTGGQSLVLQKSIDIVNSVLFTSGFFNLNGFDVDLETSGSITGENNDSRFIGANGGQVLLRTTLNAPSNFNPGNLGIVFTSDQDLGQVIIKRGHQSQSGTGLTASILRYYELSSANNTNLNATLQFNYFDGELNGFDENSLNFFRSDNAINWSDIGFTLRNAAANFVENAGINSVSRFTLANGNGSPLPVQFISFRLSCEKDKVQLTWKTAQEQNSNRFSIEKSTDQSSWMVIASLPAAGNSNNEKTYTYTDDNPVQNAYYRIAEYDQDGRVQYTTVLRSSCSVTDRFSAWPNPAHEKLFINIVASGESQAQVKLFDSKGALVKAQTANVSKGSNQLSVDIASLANGIYHLSVEWNNGQASKSTQVLKQ